MFLREKALGYSDEGADPVLALVDLLFADLLREYGCCGGFLCRWNEGDGTSELICASEIPESPFRANKYGSLHAFMAEGLRHFAEPHVHSVSDALWRDVSSLLATDGWHHRAFLIPCYVREMAFVIVGFAQPPTSLKLTDEFRNAAAATMSTVAFLLSAATAQRKLRVTELYVREVGHDIASAVQAIIPKLRNVRKGTVQGDAAREKLTEAESEILSAYRVADSLGITVDPEYRIDAGKAVDLKAVASEVTSLCRSEAAERHIEIRVDEPDGAVEVWGDKRALVTATMHLVMNAIKYAKGASTIKVMLMSTARDVQLHVTDIGKPLDTEELAHMWEFGWRGPKAKDMHVNGSGIGLYTVRKIILAHGGSVGAVTGEKPEMVTFHFSIVKRHQYQRGNSWFSSARL